MGSCKAKHVVLLFSFDLLNSTQMHLVESFINSIIYLFFCRAQTASFMKVPAEIRFSVSSRI
jgi:hypothetical protein